MQVIQQLVQRQNIEVYETNLFNEREEKTMERIDKIILELLTKESICFNDKIKKLNISRRTLFCIIV